MSMIQVNQRNQIAIPHSILAHMGIKPGDYVEIVEEEGEVFLKPAPIGEEKFLASHEWDKLDALVENQLQAGEYTEYKSLAEAKGHSRRRMAK